MISKSLFQSGVAMIGAITNLNFISSNADLHDSSKSNLTSFSSSLHNGLQIFENSFINLLKNLARPKKILIPLTVVGGIRVSIIDILVWSSSSPTEEILCPKIIPSITIK